MQFSYSAAALSREAPLRREAAIRHAAIGDAPGDRPGRGIVLMLAAMLLFASMDAASKLLTARHPVPEIVFVRFAVFLAFALALAARRGVRATLRSRRPTLQAVRSLLLVLEIAAFVAAFSHMPLADAHAIAAIAPLVATALAVPPSAKVSAGDAGAPSPSASPAC